MPSFCPAPLRPATQDEQNRVGRCASIVLARLRHLRWRLARQPLGVTLPSPHTARCAISHCSSNFFDSAHWGIVLPRVPQKAEERWVQ